MKIILFIMIGIEIVMVILTLILINLIYKLKELVKKSQAEHKTKTRKHTTIKTSNYNNAYNRRGYDQFKNKKTGLYEPQKPHQGIELKPKKEE